MKLLKQGAHHNTQQCSLSWISSPHLLLCNLVRTLGYLWQAWLHCYQGIDWHSDMVQLRRVLWLSLWLHPYTQTGSGQWNDLELKISHPTIHTWREDVILDYLWSGPYYWTSISTWSRPDAFPECLSQFRHTQKMQKIVRFILKAQSWSPEKY